MLSLTCWPVWLAGSARSMVLGAQLESDPEYLTLNISGKPRPLHLSCEHQINQPFMLWSFRNDEVRLTSSSANRRNASVVRFASGAPFFELIAFS